MFVQVLFRQHLVEQLTDCTMIFSYAKSMTGRPREITISKRNPSEGCGPQNGTRRQSAQPVTH